MDKHICADCSREFQSAESLNQHRQAKHSVQPASAGYKPKKKLPMKLIVGVLLLLIVIGGFVVFGRNHSGGNNGQPNVALDPEEQRLLKYNLGSMSGNMGMHIHPVVHIFILGSEQKIPANAGISGSFMHVIHTHDDTGTIHVESPQAFAFKLRDVFIVWGKNFNQTCILQYCADENHTLTMTVNGEPSNEYGDLVLKDGDQIKISYDSK